MIQDGFHFKYSPILKTSRQLILVLGDSWDNCHAQLHLCEKKSGFWRVVKVFPVVCGQNGMAWGLGIYPESPYQQPFPAKTEGDRKTPVGVFHFGTCLGYGPELVVNPKISYQQITPDLLGVDDPASRYYNQVVDRAKLPPDWQWDWNSHEVMLRTDDLYKWLIIIKHNSAAIPGAGSLIFMHVWKDADTGTAGCTALAAADLLQVLSWLNQDLEPVLVQLPRVVYHEKQLEWQLPLL